MCGDRLVLVAEHGITYVCDRADDHDGPHTCDGVVWTEGNP